MFCGFCLLVTLLRTDTNQVYGYLAAWCTGLWIAALFNVDWKAVFSAFLMFLLVYVIDSFGKHFVFTIPQANGRFHACSFRFRKQHSHPHKFRHSILCEDLCQNPVVRREEAGQIFNLEN